MPIISSRITEDSEQADGRRWITEEHNAETGNKYIVTYLAESVTNVEDVMNIRVTGINQSLVDAEISKYLNKIEIGLNVIGLDYTETTQAYRALQFLMWAKQMIQEENFQAIRWAYLVTDPYSETQINNLMAGTAFDGKADKIKTWVFKIKEMKLAMDEAAAGEV